MSIAPISSALKTYQPGAVQGDRQIRQDVQNIARAPGGAQAPDYIAGAKDAFSAVQQLLQNPQAGKSSQTQGGANKLQNQPQNQPATDFLAVGIVHLVLGAEKFRTQGDVTAAEVGFSAMLVSAGDEIPGLFEAGRFEAHPT